MSEKEFKFHIPVELQKSEDDQWKVKGIASTPDQDLQGEIVDQEGLDISALKAGRGLFNWDHQKGPENVLGQIEDAEFKEIDGKRVLEVEGYLFKDNDRSKGFYSIMNGIKKGASPRVHMSIEGKILERDFVNQKKIKKARIDKVALTLDPVNPYTYAELVKSLTAHEDQKVESEPVVEDTITMTKSEFKEHIEFAVQKALYPSEKKCESVVESPAKTKEQCMWEIKDCLSQMDSLKDKRWMLEEEFPDFKEEFEKEYSKLKRQAKKLMDEYSSAKKSLAAGADAGAPSGKIGGATMQSESLESDVKTTTYKEKKKKSKKEMVKSLMNSLKNAHPDRDPMELAGWALEAFMEQIENKESQRD